MLPVFEKIKKYGVDTDSVARAAATSNVFGNAEKYDEAKLRNIHIELFGTEPVTFSENPRYELSLLIRYTIQNLVKGTNEVARAQAMAVADVARFLKNNAFCAAEVGNGFSSEMTANTQAAKAAPKIDPKTGKEKAKKGDKQKRAVELYEKHKGKPNAEIVAVFMKELDMSKAGATTYVYNCKKGIFKKD